MKLINVLKAGGNPNHGAVTLSQNISRMGYPSNVPRFR